MFSGSARPLLTLALFCSLTFTDSMAATFPVTVTDDRAKDVTIDSKPQTVASISVFGADVLSKLGKPAAGLSTLNHQQSAFLGDQTANMVDLGEVHETNLEVLTELNPDLIVGLRQYTEPFAPKFEEIGHFLAFDLVTLEDSNRAIAQLGAALGETETSAQLNTDFERLLNEFNQRAPGGVNAVILWHWADIPYGFYDHYLTTQILTALKVNNLVGASPTPSLKKPDSTVISMEALYAMNPDVIISFKGERGDFAYHPVWERLAAVKNQKAFRVNDQYVMPHGPIAREMVLREMAHLFYPEVFAKPTDIPQKAQATQMVFRPTTQ